MRRRIKLSWAVKICILVAFLLLVTGGAVTSVGFMHGKKLLAENLAGRGWGMVHTATALAAQPLAAGDVSSLGRLVGKMGREPSVAYAAILDVSGRAVAHSDPGQVGGKKNDLQTIRALTARGDYLQYYKDESGRATVLDLVSPVRDGQGTVIGYLRLGMDARPIQRQLYGLLALSGVATLAMIFIGCLFTLFLIRHHLDRPVLALRQVTSEAAAGDFSGEISTEWPDDLGALVHSLHMVRALLANLVGPLREGLADLQETAETLLRACDRPEDDALAPGEVRPIVERVSRVTERLHKLTLQVKT